MTDIEKVRQVEYRSHLLQVKTCRLLMEQINHMLGEQQLDTQASQVVRDLSVAVANIGGRVPQ